MPRTSAHGNRTHCGESPADDLTAGGAPQLLESLLEHLPQDIMISSTTGGSDPRQVIRYASRSILRLVGRDLGDVVGRPVPDALGLREGDDATVQLGAAIQAREAVSISLREQTRPGLQ
ncbi:MAG: hypothetical protein ACYTGG_08305 [Planctomycetota bacterium]